MKTTVYDWELHQGAAVDLLIPVTGLPTTGVGVRCHIRDSVDAVAPRLILAHDNPANRRVTVSADGIRIQIGATVTGGLEMAQPRNLWGYDVEVYSLTDADDVLKPRAGTIYAYKEWTREADTVAMPPLASGDGRYLRIDGDQGLTPEQQAWAQHNANTGPGGPGGTSDHGALAGLADDDHPQYHNDARGDARYDAIGAATAAVGAHAGATDPHGDRAYTDTQIAGRQAASATLTTLSSATAAGLALMDDATAADQRTTLGLGSAATANSGDFAAASHTHAASAIDSGTLDAARLPSATTSAIGAVELATVAEVEAGTDTARAVTPQGYRTATPPYADWGASADKTLALTDAAVDQWCNNGATARVLNIPANSSVAFATGTKIPILRLGSGTCTIDAATGVTLNGVSGGSCTISTQYQGALLTKTGTDSWVISGDVSAVA